MVQDYKNVYDTGIHLDTHTEVTGEDFEKILSDLFHDYQSHLLSEGKNWIKDPDSKMRKKHRKTLKSILTSCYSSWSISDSNEIEPIIHGLSPNYFSLLPFSLDIFKSVMQWLSSKDYIGIKVGFYDRNKKSGKRSRLTIEEKLANKLKSIQSTISFHFPQTKIINIRDHNKKDSIDCPDTLHAFNQLDKYQSGISTLEKQLTINNQKPGSQVKNGLKYVALNPYHRSFNNSCYGEGGRFYGCLIQTMPARLRKKITLNNNPVIEADYNNLHLVMLYQLHGKNLAGDGYSQGQLKSHPRKLVKKAVLIMINSTTDMAAQKAVQKEINDGGLQSSIKAKTLIDIIKDEHSTICESFNSGDGVKLQNIDSGIALEVMHHFASKDITCLSIHDSFIIEEQHKDELIEVMKAKYNQAMTLEQYIWPIRKGIPPITNCIDSSDTKGRLYRFPISVSVK